MPNTEIRPGGIEVRVPDDFGVEELGVPAAPKSEARRGRAKGQPRAKATSEAAVVPTAGADALVEALGIQGLDLKDRFQIVPRPAAPPSHVTCPPRCSEPDVRRSKRRRGRRGWAAGRCRDLDRAGRPLFMGLRPTRASSREISRPARRHGGSSGPIHPAGCSRRGDPDRPTAAAFSKS